MRAAAKSRNNAVRYTARNGRAILREMAEQSLARESYLAFPLSRCPGCASGYADPCGPVSVGELGSRARAARQRNTRDRSADACVAYANGRVMRERADFSKGRQRNDPLEQLPSLRPCPQPPVPSGTGVHNIGRPEPSAAKAHVIAAKA